jgi:thioesterase domain-containing protein
MSVIDRTRYVTSGAWKRFVRRPMRRRRMDRYVRAGEPIPIEDNLRNAYFWSMHARASREYRVEPIDAPLLIIGEEGSSGEHQRLWSPLATDGLEITEVHGDHNSLAREPVVAEVAAVLQAAIDGASEL